MALRPAWWLEARARFGLVRHLGSGSSRETWLLHGGERVLKFPHPQAYSDAPAANDFERRARRDVERQMLRELELMARGRTRSGFPVARGEAVYLQGGRVLCLIMELITPWKDFVARVVPHRVLLTPAWRGLIDAGLAATRSDHFANPFFERLPELGPDAQWGYDARGRAVVYDAGRE